MGGRALSRRRFLRDAGMGTGLGVIAGAALSACGAGGLAPAAFPPPGPDRSAQDKVVRFANWPLYVDTVPGHPHEHPTLAEFTRRTGIKVDYSVPITGNEQFFGQIGISLAMGRNPGYDMAVLTDWMVAELLHLGWAETLSPARVPNARRLLQQLRNWPVPGVSHYSLPWVGGFTGIGYNLSVTHRPVTGMRDLLTSPELHGKVSLVTDFRDVIGLLMLDLGIDPADFTHAEFSRAVAVLSAAVRSGQVRAVTNYYPPALIRGTTAACVAWAGDILFAQPHHPEVRFTWPRAGGMLWTDNMVILAHAPHRQNAERLMNFYYDPLPAAQLAVWNKYLCPVLGAEEPMRHIDPGLVTEKFVFPTPRVLRNGHYFQLLTPAQNASYNNAYATAVGL
jgi:spermidine/putrescine transport system substrate-binding protein